MDGLSHQLKPIPPLPQLPDQPLQPVIEFIRPARMGADVQQQNKPIQTRCTFLFITQYALHDLLTAAVAPAHIRRGVIGVRTRTRAEVDELQAQFLCPAADRGVVPLVGGQEEGGVLLSDTEAGHLPVVGPQVFGELLFSDEEGITVAPGRIKEVPVGMGAEVVAAGLQPVDQPFIIGMAVKIAGEEEMGGNLLRFQHPADVIAPVVVISSGENEVDGFSSSIPADDGALVEDAGGAGGGGGLIRKGLSGTEATAAGEDEGERKKEFCHDN